MRPKGKPGGKPVGEQPMDPHPITLKLAQGIRPQLKAIDGWQDKLRAAIEQIIEEHKVENNDLDNLTC